MLEVTERVIYVFKSRFLSPWVWFPPHRVCSWIIILTSWAYRLLRCAFWSVVYDRCEGRHLSGDSSIISLSRILSSLCQWFFSYLLFLPTRLQTSVVKNSSKIYVCSDFEMNQVVKVAMVLIQSSPYHSCHCYYVQYGSCLLTASYSLELINQYISHCRRLIHFNRITECCTFWPRYNLSNISFWIS
jgi:hypothetical protein